MARTISTKAIEAYISMLGVIWLVRLGILTLVLLWGPREPQSTRVWPH